MTFVVDASVTLAWVLDDESSAAADQVLERLLTEDAIAPAHWPLEVANGLRSAERRGRIDEAGIRRVRSMLGDLPIAVLPISLTGAGGLIDVARRSDLSVYDAAYVDLAWARDVELASVDGHLRTAAERAGVRLAPDDLRADPGPR